MEARRARRHPRVRLRGVQGRPSRSSSPPQGDIPPAGRRLHRAAAIGERERRGDPGGLPERRRASSWSRCSATAPGHELSRAERAPGRGLSSPRGPSEGRAAPVEGGVTEDADGAGAPIEVGADPGRAPARRAEPAPARGRHPRRGPAAGAGRRRLGQDAGADPPRRLAAGHRAGAAERDPRDHLHQQGRRGDARARRRAGRRRLAPDVGDDLPRRLRPAAADRGRAARLHAEVHDLRRGRLAADAEALPRGARGGHQALPAARGPGAHLRREERADRRRDLPGAGGAARSRTWSARPTACTSAGCSRRTRWTSTTC